MKKKTNGKSQVIISDDQDAAAKLRLGKMIADQILKTSSTLRESGTDNAVIEGVNRLANAELITDISEILLWKLNQSIQDSQRHSAMAVYKGGIAVSLTACAISPSKVRTLYPTGYEIFFKKVCEKAFFEQNCTDVFHIQLLMDKSQQGIWLSYCSETLKAISIPPDLL